MSNYRDDSQDTAIANDFTWANLSAILEDSARAAVVLLATIGVLHQDAALAADEVIDQPLTTITETARASDAVLDALGAAVLVEDSARASEALTHGTLVLHEDAAQARDETTGSTLAILTDTAQAIDEVIGQRAAYERLSDAARASDFAGQFARDMVAELVTAVAEAPGRLQAVVLIEDSAAAGDETTGEAYTGPAALEDSARASGAVTDQLHAVDLLQDMAVADGEPVGSGDAGQAWTANSTAWAMSRYAPYSFETLAVIDGVLHGVAADGVYALDGGAAPVAGQLTTGKLDVGQGALAHPVQALIEYEMDEAATAEMAVTTTQAGPPETYAYPLQARPAATDRVSGRFLFGRGLRGRHFAFELRVTGTRAYINDLSVNATPTKRRV